MAKRQPRTVLEACVVKLGVHRGAIVAAYVAQYAIAADELGHVPSTSEYRDYWAISERTAWLHRSKMRDVFGEEWRTVVESVVAAMGKSRSPRKLIRTPVFA
jgi:hypothetical protein